MFKFLELYTKVIFLHFPLKNKIKEKKAESSCLQLKTNHINGKVSTTCKEGNSRQDLHLLLLEHL